MSEKEEKLFNEVFLQFHPMLLNFGRKVVSDEHVAEEAIQELFLYIYEKKINLASIKNMRAYLFTSFRRRILLKKNNPKLTYLSSVPTDIQFLADDFVEEDEEQLRRNLRLSKLLNDLPWRQREAIYLRYFNQLPVKEIADVMGIQPQVVANTIYKALKKMKEVASTLPYLALILQL